MISETGMKSTGCNALKCHFRKELGFNEETMKVMEWGVRWAVEARRKGSEEQEKRGQQEQEQNTGQEHSKQCKQVRFDEEDCWKRHEQEVQTNQR